MKKLITLIIIAGLALTTQAQEKKLVSGNSFNVMIPQGKMADTYDHGIGIYGNIDYNFNKYFAARFDLGWNDVSGLETTYVDPYGNIHTNHPNMSVWEFTGGLRASISVFYLEIRGGYFTGINEWGYVPAVGLRFGKLDIQGSYTFGGDSEWVSARIGYYWGK